MINYEGNRTVFFIMRYNDSCQQVMEFDFQNGEVHWHEDRKLATEFENQKIANKLVEIQKELVEYMKIDFHFWVLRHDENSRVVDSSGLIMGSD